jgi:hypothetical protein
MLRSSSKGLRYAGHQSRPRDAFYQSHLEELSVAANVADENLQFDWPASNRKHRDWFPGSACGQHLSTIKALATNAARSRKVVLKQLSAPLHHLRESPDYRDQILRRPQTVFLTSNNTLF